MTGRVVVVTGASRGIGLATARALAEAGAVPIMVARDQARLVDSARSVGDPSLAIAADVSDSRSVQRLFALVAERHGRLDGLVNNAAVAWPHRVEDVTDEELQAEVGTNLVGPLLTARVAVPAMRRSGGGDIVNISTESARDPFPFLALYAATKAGMEVLTEGLARELRAEPIRVTLLVAGRTAGGEFTTRWPADKLQEAQQAWNELGFRTRVSGEAPQPPARVADAVVFVMGRPPGTVIDRLSVRAHAATAG